MQRIALRLTCFLLLSLFITGLRAQTLGGRSVFHFLRLSNTPQLTALGAVNVSQASNDEGLAFNNPGQLRPSMHAQLNAVFNNFYSGIKVFHLSAAYHHPRLNTNFSWGLNYFNYGSTTETDAAGNILGSFRPTDWVMQVSASRIYLGKWNYGATLKFIGSNYGQYRSNGIAGDVGIFFNDTTHLFSAGAVVKNAGFQLKKYPGTGADELPFDLQAGITKRLAHAPVSFSLTAQRIHRFNIRYEDTAFNNENGFRNAGGEKFSAGKLLDHLVIATTIYPSPRLEVIAGYNFLRRRELNIGNANNGLNGFSVGVGALFGKLQVRYARAYYQANSAYNQLGLNLQLNEYFGFGKWGEKMGW